MIASALGLAIELVGGSGVLGVHLRHHELAEHLDLLNLGNAQPCNDFLEPLNDSHRRADYAAAGLAHVRRRTDRRLRRAR